MAYFWVLKNGSQRGGVTVHWIDEGIDTGAILARRSFHLTEKATQETVLMMTAVIGAALVRRIVKKIIADEKLNTFSIDQEENNYYALPAEKDFGLYFQRRRFFRIRDILGLLIMKKHK